MARVNGTDLLSDRRFPEFPVWGGPADRLRFLLPWGLLAPSRHNTQPWTFEIEGDELRLYADLSRALPAADPDGRQLLMSAGAVIVNLRLAAAHFGHATTSEVIPGLRRDGLLARVRLEERSASTPELEELYRAIPLRRTNRLPLDGREPPEGLVAALVREARREGASLRPVEPHERPEIAELVAEGDRRQWASARFRSELSAWLRSNGSTRRDGMPGHAMGMSDAAAMLRSVLLRFGGDFRDEAERDRRRALSSRALLVLSTARDGKGEWITAGETLQRVLLRAAARGLYASYFSQVTETPELRRSLTRALVDPGAPQIMFRLGYGLDVRPVPRRRPGELLRRWSETRPAAEPLAVVRAPPAPTQSTASRTLGP